MQLMIEGRGIELSDALRGYAEEKVRSLEKFADILKADVELGKDSHHAKGEVYFCEVHIFISGKDFFIKKEGEEMYKIIDEVKDHLQDQLTSWKDRQVSEKKTGDETGEEEVA